jgi:hypothetical protein
MLRDFLSTVKLISIFTSSIIAWSDTSFVAMSQLEFLLRSNEAAFLSLHRVMRCLLPTFTRQHGSDAISSVNYG